MARRDQGHGPNIHPLKIDRDPSHGHSRVLWEHIGQRLRLRRTQLRLETETVAKTVGVPPQLYEQYEYGRLQTPAALLSDLAQLFHLPVTWFFQDLSGDEADAGNAEEPGVFMVATDDERVRTLTDYFRNLDLEDQQHVLLLARTLYRARKGSAETDS